MERTDIDYKLLYEQTLEKLLEEQKKSMVEKEKSLEVIAQKEERIVELSFELDKFRKYIFGKKSERFIGQSVDASQTQLFELGTTQEQQEELSAQAAETARKKKPKKRAKGTGRMVLPENLRREDIIIEPREDISGCKRIGEEITEVLDLIPAEFYVKRYIRPKYARPNDQGIVIGMLPDRAIDKGIPSERVVASMMVDKFTYGMPLYRQIDKYRRLGVNIPASTASDWMIKGWRVLIPLWELLKLMVLNQKYLQADETPLKVQDRNHKDNIHKGYIWIYNAPVENLVLFDYRKGRDQSGPQEMLKDFTGILQSDGYAVYDTLFANHPNIILIFCLAHARRKYQDSLKYDREKASYVLERMQVLYNLEREMRENEVSWEEKTKLRQEKAGPILKELKDWMIEQAPKIPPKSPLGKAIAYSLPRWEGLSAYIMHGQVEIDNNLAENSIRALAVGRKNYLFAGSHQAAEMIAAMYSFMASCKRNGVNETEWLTDVLERIQSYKQKDLYQLLPNNWAKYRKTQGAAS